MTSAATHADKRYRYMRGLWQRASSSSVVGYRDKEFQHLCKALTRISVCREALQSRHAVRDSVRGCGDGVIELLREFDESGSDNSPPKRGLFCGAAAALLVALLQVTEQEEGVQPALKEPGVVGKLELLESAAMMCEQTFLPRDVYTRAVQGGAKQPRCAAGQQLASLCTLQYVKEMQRKKLCVTGEAYKLTEEGRQRASELRVAGEAAEAAPLYSHRRVLPGECSVVLLLVDEREGGGAKHHLATLADALRRNDCRFETRVLPTGMGDYQFVLANSISSNGTATRETGAHACERRWPLCRRNSYCSPPYAVII